MVPVVDINQQPLMPCSEKRARKMIESGKATPFWKRGIFCIRLNVEPSARNLQKIAVGIDPGSKKEGYTVKSKHYTYLNIQADAVTWVKRHIENRRASRKSRRNRKTPYRKCRKNRKGRTLAPSTKARWQWKLRVCRWLAKMFPISVFVVEDIKAKTKKGRSKWNKGFSPLEYGKTWFYEELKKMALVEKKMGWRTKQLRDELGLEKSQDKLSNSFSSHCVDSWVLANDIVGGHKVPENKKVLFLVPLKFHRRQLHVFQSSKNGKRKRYGGTISLGLKKGSFVSHSKHGIAYVGGASKEKITLCSPETGKRINRNVNISDCRFLTYSSFRIARYI